MTDITCTPPRSGVLARLGGLVRASADHYRREAEIRNAIRTLSRFDDHLLQDIGLTREDLKTRVRGGDRD